MIEEKAVVVSVNENGLVVEASRQSACGKCSSKSDCGQSSVAEWAASKMVNIAVENPQKVDVTKGDTVIVGINEHSFIKASLLLYFYPLIVMFICGALSTYMGLEEGVVICISFISLLVSFYAVKLYSQKFTSDKNYQLTLVAVL